MAAYVEQNFLLTSKATEFGRGERTNFVMGPKFKRPDPGEHDVKRLYDG